MNIQKHATYFGVASLVIWGFSAAIVTTLNTIPTLEILSITLWISCSLSAIYFTLTRRWSDVKGWPPHLWFAGLMGTFGNTYLYIRAFHLAPALHVDLINYSWPILYIGLLWPMERQKPKAYHLFAALLGAFAIGVLLTAGEGFSGFHMDYLQGYLFALCAALVWGVYVLVSSRHIKAPVAMMGLFAGMGACIVTGLIVFKGIWVKPTGVQWASIVYLGACSQSLAYIMWDFGVKRGDVKALSIWSYITPIISVLALIVIGQGHITTCLVIACCLLILALAISDGRFSSKKHSS